MRGGIASVLIKRAQQRMESAQRFRLRGDCYLADGKKEHAEGCFKKAERNIALATKELQSMTAWAKDVNIG